ncbi:MAG: PQQ-dependent sugar dehydrogenase [Bradymonadia bacterium]
MISKHLWIALSAVTALWACDDTEEPANDRDVAVGPCNAPACIGGSGGEAGAGGEAGMGGTPTGGMGGTPTGGAGGVGGVAGAGGEPGGAGGVVEPDAFVLPDAGLPDAEIPDAGRPVMNPLVPRVENRTCAFPEIPPAGDMEIELAFGNLDFARPLWLGTAPGDTDHIYVMEQGGRILVFDDDREVDETEVFLDLSVSRAGNEEGLLGLAFHPDYAENGRLFLYYSASNPRRSVISEWSRDRNNPLRVDPASERIILEVGQPFSNHNGGDMHFGPDDYLYISLGDGGSGGDPENHGQRPTTLLGSVLRIDIDNVSPGCNYGIPPDNPFAVGNGCAGGQEGRPEIWAWGLRNVWRMSFDRSTGELWAGDVGQGAYEEIDILEGGRNYGWNQVEGFACYRRGCDPSAYADPVFAYGRGEGQSITGGYVYRGPDFPELYGAYIYADYRNGRIWALRLRPGAEPVNTLLVDTPVRIASFGEDIDGRLYFTAFDGHIWGLRRRAQGPEVQPLPPRLSDTGCFDDLTDMAPAAGVIPYQLNVPFWSDNARKSRFVAMPEGGAATYTETGAFEFPLGTVVIKHFEIDDAAGNSRRLETRFMVHQPTGWQGYTYRWNAEQTDAVLLTGAMDEVVSGPEGEQTWHYPARSDCDGCHTEAAGHVLGFRGQQLDRTMVYGDVQYPQLEALSEAGLLSGDLPAERQAFPRLNDNAVPLAERARVMLDVNCAMCHQPDGPGNATIDLRVETPFAEQRLCNAEPGQGDLGLAGARIVAPGEPARSVLLQRMSVLGEDRMPPVGSNVVDAEGVRLIQSWIESMNGCE